jgi:phage terminase large subunit-like protein
MVTPNRDRSVKISRLVEEFETAKLVGEAEVVRWASQHLNIEIGVGLRTDRWRGADYWQSAVDPDLTLETLIERSEVIVVGIDGGGHDDLFAFAALGRERGTRHWLLWTRAWALRQVLSVRQSIAAQLLDLERAGELSLVDNIEHAFIEAAMLCAEIDAAGLLARVGLDPFGVGAVIDALAEQEIVGDRVVGISQGWQMSGSIKTAEVKLANGTMWHADQALMRWCVSNAKIEPRGNAVTMTKQVAGSGKIDPVIASLCAVALMSRNPEAAPVLEIAAMVA